MLATVKGLCFSFLPERLTDLSVEVCCSAQAPNKIWALRSVPSVFQSKIGGGWILGIFSHRVGSG